METEYQLHNNWLMKHQGHFIESYNAGQEVDFVQVDTCLDCEESQECLFEHAKVN